MTGNNPHKDMNNRLKAIQEAGPTAEQKTASMLIEETRTWLKETMGGSWGPLWIALQKTKTLEEEVVRLLAIEKLYHNLQLQHESLVTKINDESTPVASNAPSLVEEARR
jgi:hypothetical protein